MRINDYALMCQVLIGKTVIEELIILNVFEGQV